MVGLCVYILQINDLSSTIERNPIKKDDQKGPVITFI